MRTIFFRIASSLIILVLSGVFSIEIPTLVRAQVADVANICLFADVQCAKYVPGGPPIPCVCPVPGGVIPGVCAGPTKCLGNPVGAPSIFQAIGAALTSNTFLVGAGLLGGGLLLSSLLSGGGGGSDSSQSGTGAAQCTSYHPTSDVNALRNDPCAVYAPGATADPNNLYGSAGTQNNVSDLLNSLGGVGPSINNSNSSNDIFNQILGNNSLGGSNTNVSSGNTANNTQQTQQYGSGVGSTQTKPSSNTNAYSISNTTQVGTPGHKVPLPPANPLTLLPFDLTRNLWGDLQLGSTSATIFADHDGMNVLQQRQFYGADVAGSGQLSAKLLCIERPWNAKPFTRGIPADFFDKLCTIRGF